MIPNLQRGDIVRTEDDRIALILTPDDVIESRPSYLVALLLEADKGSQEPVDIEIGPELASKIETGLEIAGVFQADRTRRIDPEKIAEKCGVATPRMIHRIDKTLAQLITHPKQG